jgi:SWI/SNF-related matrix-associated actin-dependent regulator of chromatin subfamily A3
LTRFRPNDQSKIRLAISLQRIDPVDVPVTVRGKPVRITPSVASTSQNHRKRTALEAGFESASTDRNLTATQEPPEEEVVDEDVADELYCTMVAKVVGIQYYTGTSPCFLLMTQLTLLIGLVGPGEEVRLIREPHNPYDR